MGTRQRGKPASGTAASGGTDGDPTRLAEQFLDLWQDQLAAVATDPDLTELVARLWTQWLTGPSGWKAAPMGEAAATPRAARPKQAAAGPPQDHEPRTETPGPAPAAAAPRDDGADLGDLVARLGALEKRLVALERAPRRSSGGAERRTRRR
jgi:hypothetical protein